MFNGSQNEFPIDIKQFIEDKGYELFSNEYPEQVQLFSQLVSSAGGTIDSLGKENFIDLYSVIFSSLVLGISDSAKKSALLKTFKVGPMSKITDKELGMVAALLGAFFPVVGAIVASEGVEPFVEANYPSLRRTEIENMSLTTLPVTQAKNAPYPAGIIDFDQMKQLIKDGYDFSKETDQLSPAIGASQKAFLKGYINAILQVFAGHVFAKMSHYLVLFPYQVFSSNSNILIEYIFDTFEADWLNSQSNEIRKMWKITVCRLVAEMSEFTPDAGYDKLPILPGETPDDEKYQGETTIRGSLYDMNLGQSVRILSWKDATKYFIRQCYESPLKFVKNQAQNTPLVNNVNNNEISPFEFVAYKNILPIHSKTLNFLGESKIGSLNVGGSPNESPFKEGKFFLQQYIELEELTPQNQDGEGNELYNITFINRNDDFKGKLNPTQFAKLISQLIPAGQNSQMGFGYDNKYKNRKVKDFFKSIKLGLRFCYGLNHPISLENSEELPETIINSSDKLLQAYQTAVNVEAVFEFFGSTSEGFSNKIRKDKSFIIFENVKLSQTYQSEPEYFEGEDGETYATVEGEQVIYDFSENEIENLLYLENDYSSTGYENFLDFIEQNEEFFTDSPMTISFILPIITRFEDITTDSRFDKKLYNIAENSSTHTDYMENLQEYFSRPSVIGKTQGLLEQIAMSEEYRVLFSYAIPIPEVIMLFGVFFNLAVDTDIAVKRAFDPTKDLIGSMMKSIYDMRGKDAYKNTPDYITKRGGPKGIAQGASSNINFNKP